MDERHSKLESARRLRGWTLEVASQKIGVHPQTLRSWEKGKRKPQGFRVCRISEVYETTPAALGLEWGYAYSPVSVSDAGSFAVGQDLAFSHFPETRLAREKLDLRLMSLIIQQKLDHGYHDYHMLQLQLDRCIREYDENLKKQPDASADEAERLQALCVIAAIPIVVYLEHADRSALPEDILIHCAAGIAVCWHMAQDSASARTFVSGYLILLSDLFTRSESYRSEAAELIAQACLLRTLLASQLGDSQASISYYLKALEFGAITEQVEPPVAPLGTLHRYGRQPEQVLERIAEAIWLLKPAPPPPDFPLICGYLQKLAPLYQLPTAESLASESLFKFGLSSDMSLPEPDQFPTNLDYADAALTLWHGLTQHELGEYARTLDTLRSFDELEAVYDAPEPVRQEFLPNRALAALRLHDMDQAISSLRTTIPAALSLGDEQDLIHAPEAYHLMQFLLPARPPSPGCSLKDLLKKHD